MPALFTFPLAAQQLAGLLPARGLPPCRRSRHFPARFSGSGSSPLHQDSRSHPLPSHDSAAAGGSSGACTRATFWQVSLHSSLPTCHLVRHLPGRLVDASRLRQCSSSPAGWWLAAGRILHQIRNRTAWCAQVEQSQHPFKMPPKGGTPHHASRAAPPVRELTQWAHSRHKNCFSYTGEDIEITDDFLCAL